MFDDKIIDLWYSLKLASMKNIIKTCNLTVRFSKFTFNIKIYEKFCLIKVVVLAFSKKL